MATRDDKTAGADTSEVVLLPPESGNELEHEDLSAEQSDPSKELEASQAEIAHLKAELAAARAAQADAGRVQEDTSQRLASESAARFNAQEMAVDAKIQSATIAIKSAKELFTKLSEEGKFADAAEVMEQIADFRAQLNAANWEKDQVAQAKERAKKEIENPPTRREVQTGTAEERFLSTIKSPESRRWLVAHKDVLSKMVSDERYFASVAAADNKAFAELGERDTPAYFEFIEGELGIDGNTSKGRGTTTSPTANRNRNASQRGDSAGRTIRLSEVAAKLTPSMRAAAKTSFPGIPEQEAYEKYARGIVISKQRDSSYLPDFKL